jgi:hypothetical protein
MERAFEEHAPSVLHRGLKKLAALSISVVSTLTMDLTTGPRGSSELGCPNIAKGPSGVVCKRQVESRQSPSTRGCRPSYRAESR